MKAPLEVLLLVMVFSSWSHAADDITLEPNALGHLYFPDLPQSLASSAKGDKRPAQLTAWLPANYSREGKFPVFLILNGGDGGFGDRLPLRPGTIGSNDFIYVNLPLFKRSYAGTNDSVVVMMEDYETMSHAYRVMLQKLFDTVPNITSERSAFGGFSNGAHALGLLLARSDPFLLKHFQSFYLIEGGFGALAASVTNPDVAPALKGSRFLLMYGDTRLADDDPTYSEMHYHLGRACVLSAQRARVDLTLLVMRGYGHELPPKYELCLKAWVRGEKIPDSGAK
jgi:predicted esterase